ncbi:RNA-directed DNA polymerase [Apilactobacillus xinyiensis]|uniref:RNA-directed DNA polymerase n=1 Tax=Apilactobacillus xinyiensis TaxID=2841032 RepID=UPI00336512A8
MIDEIITKESALSLYNEIHNNKNINLFKSQFYENQEILYSLINTICPPNYIYGNNWAAESIKFFTIKKDDSWRPMAVPNIKHALMFMYNSINIADSYLNELYSKNERLQGKTRHSESPIIGRNGMISSTLYDGITNNDVNTEDEKAVGYIGYNNTNKFFKDSKLQRFRLESVYPYVLQIDISKFFENVYTHLLAQINIDVICESKNKIFLDKYLKWLDEYNQKINDNHTKGIIQGPISSKISAELFQIYLDQLIVRVIKDNKLDVDFTRYVDDYRFYAKKYSDLDLMKNIITKIFRSYELSINESKTKIYKGFELQNQSYLMNYSKLKYLINKNNIHKRLSFNDYLILRDNIILMLDRKELPTIKSVLTLLNKNISKDNISFYDNEIVYSFVTFLIKLSYVKPILSDRIYKLIQIIIDKVSSDYKKKLLNLLLNEIDYVEKNFSGTDLEIWHFYLISNAGNSKNVIDAFDKYKHQNHNELNVLVLTVLLKQGNTESNNFIEKEILKHILPNCKNWISQSKWWLPIAKLWIVNKRDVDINIRSLFFTKKNNIFWERLGIIEFLMENV